MKARQRQALALAGVFAGIALGGAPLALEAQTTRTPDPNAPRMMIPALRSTEKGLGVQAADAIRSRLNQDISYKSLWQIPKNDIIGTLEASGYPKDEALAPNDARELGKLLRADEYLQGTVAKNNGQFRIESQLVLVRDNSLVQPLPVVEGGRLDIASAALSKHIQAARKQLDGEKKCVQLAREGKYPEAIAAAKAGIGAYQQATLARACMASAMVASKAPGDSVIAVTQEILAIDPKNRPALSMAAQAYKDAGQQDKAIETWTALLATDPTNARLVDNVVREIASSGNPAVALPIIKQAVAANPGDPQLLRLQWRIQLAAKDNKGAIATGEQMVQLDTAMADTNYFVGMSVAYAADSQPQKATEALAKGAQKFPGNAGMQVALAQTQRQAGQLPQAIETINKALAANPKVEHGLMLKAQIHSDLKQTDSALAVVRQAATGGDTLAGPIALSIGNQLYKDANVSKKPEDFQRAIQTLAFADSLIKNPTTKAQAQFLMGVSQLSLGQQQLTLARDQKSCELAQQAQANFVEAQINLPKGGAFAKEATAQALNGLQQLMPYGEQLSKSLCKGRRG